MRRLALRAILLVPLLFVGCAPRTAALLPTIPSTIVKEGPEARLPKPPPRPVPATPPAAADRVPAPTTASDNAAPAPGSDNVATGAVEAPPPTDNATVRPPTDNAAPPPAGTDNGASAPPRADNAAAVPVAPPSPPPAELFRKRYEEAIALTRDAIGRNEPRKALPAWTALEGTPWEREARFNRAVLLHLSGDTAGAEAGYRFLAEADPPHEGACANLLGLLLMQGRGKEGIPLVDRIFPPGHPVAAGGVLPELAGNAAALLLDAGMPDRAAPLLADGSFRGSPPPGTAWNRTVLAWKLGDGEGARKASALLSPGTAALWPVKASRLAWEGDDLGRRIEALEPPPPDDRRLPSLARTFSAREAWRKGDREAVERELRAAAAEHPGEAAAGLSLLLMEAGRWKEARTELAAVTTRHPSIPEGWLNLGIFREVYEGNGAAAAECYRKYVSLGGSRKDEVVKWIEWLERSPSR